MTTTELRITSRAAVARAIATPGIKITVEQHWQPQLVGTVRVPLVARKKSGRPGIQGNGYYFDGPRHDGTICEMWAELPKADQLAFHDDNRVTFHPDTAKSWTLRFEIAA